MVRMRLRVVCSGGMVRGWGARVFGGRGWALGWGEQEREGEGERESGVWEGALKGGREAAREGWGEGGQVLAVGGRVCGGMGEMMLDPHPEVDLG